MANYCYNSVQIFGKEKTLKKLQDKFNYYEKTNYFVEFGDYILDKKFNPEDKERDYYEYGTRWWDFETDLDSKNFNKNDECTLNISGDSAWSPPVKLIREICNKFKVGAEMFYEESGNDFMGETKFIWNKGELYCYEKDYSYREGMYKLSDFWHDDMKENIDDGLFSIVHMEDYDGADMYDHMMNLFDDFIKEEDREEILDYYLEITDKELDRIINHEFRKNESTLKDKKKIREYINKVINKINQDYAE
tara:strand:- start:775 stop:1521 length:747 start_codon:yes stop_codon:yes gene_type:complete